MAFASNAILLGIFCSPCFPTVLASLCDSELYLRHYRRLILFLSEALLVEVLSEIC